MHQCNNSSEKIIVVSFTSWVKRIQHAGLTIYSMLSQTRKPDRILLQLSKTEFPNMWDDLPLDLRLICQLNQPTVQLRWHNDNTKAFKKVIPAIQEFRAANAWILSIDDDIIYDKHYIEYMVSEANNDPTTCCTPGFSKIGNGLMVHGCGMIYNPQWFTNNTLFSYTLDDVNRIIASDHWITAALYTNGIKFRKLANFLDYVKFIDLGNPLSDIYSTNAPIALRAQYIISKFQSLNYNVKPLFKTLGILHE